MLNLLVSLRRGREGEQEIGDRDCWERIAGDIVVAAKHPAQWGQKERARFLIVLYDDPELEASIIGERMIFPFALKDGGGNVLFSDLGEHLNRSIYRVDLTMFEGSPGLDPLDDTSEPVAPTQGSISPTHLQRADLVFNDLCRC